MNPDDDLDVAGDLGAAFDEAESTEAPTEVEATDDTLEAVEAAEDAPEAVEGDDEVDGEADDEAPVTAPEDWDEDSKALFEAMPDNVAKQFILERERAAAEAVTARMTDQYKDVETLRKQVQEFDEIFKPHEQQLALSGATKAQAVRQLMAAQDFLNRDPLQAIKWLAQSYNVDLNAAADPGNEEYVDPRVARLESTIQQLQNQTATTTQQIQRDRMAAVEQTIDVFRTASGEDGQPLHPHFDLLQPHMSQLLTAGKARTLDDAYSQATAAYNLATATPKPVGLTSEQKRAAVERAKAASKGLKSRGKPVRAVSAGAIADDLEAAWDQSSS